MIMSNLLELLDKTRIIKYEIAPRYCTAVRFFKFQRTDFLVFVEIPETEGFWNREEL